MLLYSNKKEYNLDTQEALTLLPLKIEIIIAFQLEKEKEKINSTYVCGTLITEGYGVRFICCTNQNIVYSQECHWSFIYIIQDKIEIY